MTKILHCITDLSPDGAQRTLLRLVSATKIQGLEHRVVTLVGGGHLVDRFEEQGVRVISLGMRKGIPGIGAILRLRSVVNEFSPDVIQGWMYHGNLAATVGGLFSNRKPRVLWNIRRGLYDSREDKVLTRAVIALNARTSKSPERIIYCVRVAADQHEAIGFDPSKRLVIPNGFDTQKFSPQPGAREWLRTTLKLERATSIVVIAGRYHPQKDYPAFIQSFARVHKALPNVHAVLVGRGVDDTCVELTTSIAENHLDKNVHLLGERQDLRDIFAGADLYCSSSANEGFSNVVSEAMSSGLPCVVTDAGASRELVEGIGIVVERRDIEGLAKGMIEILEMNSEERKVLGEKSRDRIVSTYSLDSMLRQYCELYRPNVVGH